MRFRHWADGNNRLGDAIAEIAGDGCGGQEGHGEDVMHGLFLVDYRI